MERKFFSQLSDEELVRHAQEVEQSTNYEAEPIAQLIRHELAHRGLLACGIDSTGLYDASQDHYDVAEHPDDERWAIRSVN